MWVCAYICAFIVVSGLTLRVCNMCDGNIPYKSSGLTLRVCMCMCMDVVRCMHVYMFT